MAEGRNSAADRYGSFAELAAASRKGVDYRIRIEDRDSPVVILAPHGGGIEPETAQIAEAIAATDFSFYAFEALQSGAHRDFHITSHRFDEPSAVGLLARSKLAVAVHGRKDDGTRTIWLGGRATELRDAIGDALRKANYGAEFNSTLPGMHEMNICNRTRSGTGVQLEIPMALRRHMATDRSRLDDFARVVRLAIRNAPIR